MLGQERVAGIIVQRTIFLHSQYMRALPFLPRLSHLRQAIALLVLFRCTLVANPLLGGSDIAIAGFPISVRFVGKIYLAPAGEKGRQRDLLPLELGTGEVVYLQVDSFHTPNRDQGELILFSDMQRHRSPLKVINAGVLAALLTENTLRGKKIAINGFLYRTAGLLWIAETHVKE